MLRRWLGLAASGSAGESGAPARPQSVTGAIRSVPGRQLWAATALFLLLTLVHTWPLAADLSRQSRVHDDVWLNAWAVSWIAHQLPRDPLRLFDANMFHPLSGALGYTEPLIVPSLMGAPILWLGGSPLLAHNVLVLLGYVLTALAMYALVRTWTGDHLAGLLAGTLFTFSTVLLTRVAHLQGVHAYWLPLAFLALHRLLARRRARDAVGLGVCVVGAALTSGYLVVFVTFALGVAALARAPDFRGRDGVRLVLQLGAAAAVTLLVLLAVLQPYLNAAYNRPPAVEAQDLSTALSSYLASAAILHYETWSNGYYQAAPGALFPGVVTLGLAAVAIGSRRRVAPRGTRRMLLAVAGIGLVLSLGALTPVYHWAYAVVPPLQGLRAISRFGLLVVFALAALAGIGWSGFRRPSAAFRRTLVTVALLVLATAESLHGSGLHGRFRHEKRIHRMLAASTWPGAVVELPIYADNGFQNNARYLLASTVHWRPLMNGYGGYPPPEFAGMARLAGAFPSVLAVAWLQEIDVGYVVMNLDRYPEAMRLVTDLTRLDQRRDLALEGVEGGTRLYRVRRAKARAIDALTPAPVLSQLRFVDGPAEGSMLRASHGLRQVYGFQSPERFIGYLEPERGASHVQLRLPVTMSGRFHDAATGAVLLEVTVRASTGADAVRVDVPAGQDEVLLDLHARAE